VAAHGGATGGLEHTSPKAKRGGSADIDYTLLRLPGFLRLTRIGPSLTTFGYSPHLLIYALSLSVSRSPSLLPLLLSLSTSSTSLPTFSTPSPLLSLPHSSLLLSPSSLPSYSSSPRSATSPWSLPFRSLAVEGERVINTVRLRLSSHPFYPLSPSRSFTSTSPSVISS
jgi:hypothetical protein